MKAFLDYLNTHTREHFRVTKVELCKEKNNFSIFVKAEKEKHFYVLHNIAAYRHKNIGWKRCADIYSGYIIYILIRMSISEGLYNWRFI